MHGWMQSSRQLAIITFHSIENSSSSSLFRQLDFLFFSEVKVSRRHISKYFGGKSALHCTHFWRNWDRKKNASRKESWKWTAKGKILLKIPFFIWTLFVFSFICPYFECHVYPLSTDLKLLFHPLLFYRLKPCRYEISHFDFASLMISTRLQSYLQGVIWETDKPIIRIIYTADECVCLGTNWRNNDAKKSFDSFITFYIYCLCVLKTRLLKVFFFKRWLAFLLVGILVCSCFLEKWELRGAI